MRIPSRGGGRRGQTRAFGHREAAWQPQSRVPEAVTPVGSQGRECFPSSRSNSSCSEHYFRPRRCSIATGSPGNGFDVGPFDVEHSPLLYLVSAAPLLAWPGPSLEADWANYWRWLPHLPFLACGMLLGASLWYVARRLCGNPGGYVALALYCFSPALIQASARCHREPEIVAAWGAFGTIFTAIAVAHTLYAPREVILWNWRRIVLLGISLAIAVGSQFSFVVVIPMALGFLLYVAPVRRQAGLVIWIAACAVG